MSDTRFLAKQLKRIAKENLSVSDELWLEAAADRLEQLENDNEALKARIDDGIISREAALEEAAKTAEKYLGSDFIVSEIRKLKSEKPIDWHSCDID